MHLIIPNRRKHLKSSTTTRFSIFSRCTTRYFYELMRCYAASGETEFELACLYHSHHQPFLMFASSSYCFY